MKRVIEGKVYNTATANRIHAYESPEMSGDFQYFMEALYRTQRGNYFIAGEGGPMSPYAESLGGGSYGGGSGITPVSLQEAAWWLEEHGGEEVLTSDDAFTTLIEEA